MKIDRHQVSGLCKMYCPSIRSKLLASIPKVHKSHPSPPGTIWKIFQTQSLRSYSKQLEDLEILLFHQRTKAHAMSQSEQGLDPCNKHLLMIWKKKRDTVPLQHSSSNLQLGRCFEGKLPLTRMLFPLTRSIPASWMKCRPDPWLSLAWPNLQGH